MRGGLAASQQILALIVAVLCFVIAAGFLLSLVPDPRRQRGCRARGRDRSGCRKLAIADRSQSPR